MTKNVVVYSDGTGQAGGVRPDQRLSNVYKLYRASRTGPESPIDPSHQVAYYDAGLGTDDDVPSAPVKFVRWLQKLLGSATGRGITRNITDCYEFILNTYEPGDRIFLVGFSRGAYTARCVAGVLSLCGVPTHDADGGPLPRFRSATRSIAEEGVRKVYEHGAGRKIADFADQRNELARRFRERYGSDSDGQANAAPYFIGVFDTVASLGSKGVFRFLLVTGLLLGLAIACAATACALSWAFGWQFLHGFLMVVGLAVVALIYSALKATLHVIWKWPTKRQFRWHIAKWDMKNYDRRLSSAVNFARHAISIDEDRADFPRVQWGFRTHDYEPQPGEAGPFKQVWFSGNHSDIGGSYPEEESRLSDITLQWMIDEATSIPCPLLLDRSRLQTFPRADGMQHSEVSGMRDTVASYLPSWWPRSWIPSWKRQCRDFIAGAPIHSSVQERLDLPSVLKAGFPGPYRPEPFKEDPRFKSYFPPK